MTVTVNVAGQNWAEHLDGLVRESEGGSQARLTRKRGQVTKSLGVDQRHGLKPQL